MRTRAEQIKDVFLRLVDVICTLILEKGHNVPSMLIGVKTYPAELIAVTLLEKLADEDENNVDSVIETFTKDTYMGIGRDVINMLLVHLAENSHFAHDVYSLAKLLIRLCKI
ncbi:hypothetical protein KJ807_05625 [Patescibacteria group bacterium]|nr:hypothetical protein [Patescibacteria group bacterium]